MQVNDKAGIWILLGKALDAVTIEIQPDLAAEMFDAADVVRRQSFAVELRLYLPVPPAGVVFLRGENHGGVGRRTSEIIVAPVGRKPTGDSRVIHLQNQQQPVLIVRANHHKYFPPSEIASREQISNGAAEDGTKLGVRP